MTAPTTEALLHQAVAVLATMTKHAPAYSVTGKQFVDAHQRACFVLHELRARGVREAR